VTRQLERKNKSSQVDSIKEASQQISLSFDLYLSKVLFGQALAQEAFAG